METLEMTKGPLNITIQYDGDSENPLDWNNSIKVAYSSSRYKFMDGILSVILVLMASIYQIAAKVQ